MEAAEGMSLREGDLIVFSRGLRHIAQDSRKAVLSWLPLMPAAPEAIAAAEIARVGSQEEGPQRFW